MFDAIAARYDFLNHFLSAGIDRGWRREAIRSLKLTGSEHMVDVCTGTGDLAIAAARAAGGAARVTGVDFAGAMLRVGAEKIERQQLASRIGFVRGDATRIPIVSASAHALTVGFGIRNVENMPAAFAEFHRVLAAGGRLAILEFAMPPNPVVRTGYRWYSKHVMPRIGRLVSRHGEAYGYLPESIDAFSPPAEIVKLLRHAGFANAAARPLTFGIVYLYTGIRDQASGIRD